MKKEDRAWKLFRYSMSAHLVKNRYKHWLTKKVFDQYYVYIYTLYIYYDVSILRIVCLCSLIIDME